MHFATDLSLLFTSDDQVGQHLIFLVSYWLQYIALQNDIQLPRQSQRCHDVSAIVSLILQFFCVMVVIKVL